MYSRIGTVGIHTNVRLSRYLFMLNIRFKSYNLRLEQ